MRCEICKETFGTLRGLHSHIAKSHACSQDSYYHQYYPRFDKFSGELIVYKNHEQYHESDFNSRENFAFWLSQNYQDPGVREYCLKNLSLRLETKNTFRLPSQVELKGIYLPTISGFSKICGSIDDFLSEVRQRGFKSRFDYSLNPIIRDLGEMKIYIDTREQKPLSFPKSECMKLSVGDYSCDSPYYSDVFIERKSLADLAGTLGTGRDRFESEIERAKELGFYIVVIVEDLFSEMLNYQSKFSLRKVTGAHLAHEIREIMTEHEHIQFVFAGNRVRAKKLIENIFKLGDQVKFLDLEYLKDEKKI